MENLTERKHRLGLVAASLTHAQRRVFNNFRVKISFPKFSPCPTVRRIEVTGKLLFKGAFLWLVVDFNRKQKSASASQVTDMRLY